MRDLQKGCKAAPKPGAAFHSLVDLQAALNRFVAGQNADPTPFTWTADPDKTIAAVEREQQVLDPLEREGLGLIT